VTYNAYFEGETSQNHSYLVLKRKKSSWEFGKTKERIKKIPRLILHKGIVILSSTEQKRGQRRVLGTTDPFISLIPLPAHIEYGRLASLKCRRNISARRPGVPGGMTGPSVDTFTAIHAQSMSFQQQFGTWGASR
jgi:hypothetical protein